MSQKKSAVTPLIELSASVTLINDRNASAALVHLYDEQTGEVIAHATGASKREQGDNFSDSVALKLTVGRAFRNMARTMISQANREVKAAMLAAEVAEAEKVQAAYDQMRDLRSEFDQRADYSHLPTIDEVMADAEAADKADAALSDLLAFLGITPEDGQEAPLPFLQDDATLADALTHALDGENLNGDGVPMTADGTPVDQLPVSLRTTLASLGFKPSDVQIIDLDKLEAEGAI